MELIFEVFPPAFTVMDLHFNLMVYVYGVHYQSSKIDDNFLKEYFMMDNLQFQ